MEVKVFLIDDEALVAEKARIIIDGLEKYKVVEVAYNFATASAIIDKGDFDLAVVDINLEEENNGIDLAKLLQEQKIPFIYLSSFADEETLGKALVHEPAGYCVKPTNKESLFAALELVRIQHLQNDRFKMFEGKKELELNVANIFYIRANGNYCEVHEKYSQQLIRSNIAAWQDLHPKLQQVHRSYVVNATKIVKRTKKSILLSNGEKIPSSEKYTGV